ncbi:hypothetical protein MLD38_036546 [Melastoma candidum]|uniref:Uncharacterized protein n=1 Tax=Melastoma candidum TaxID=119954 RepID=A0ACB9LK92_9MYRT|nr:hypothetical protein MLD38_036546 [Melastoma candidum]
MTQEHSPSSGDPPQLMESPSLNEKIKKAIVSYNHEEAARLYSEGIALYPRNPNYHTGRATANIFLQNFQGAIIDSTNALLLDQGHKLLRGLPYLHMGRALIGLGEFDHAFTIVSEGLKVDSADMRLKRCLELARMAGTCKMATSGHSTGTDTIGDVFEGGEMWLKLDGDMVATEYRHDPEFRRKVSEARRDNLKLGKHLREDKRFLKAFESLLNVKFAENVGRAAPEAEIEGYEQPELIKLCEMFSQVDVTAEKMAGEQEEEAEEAEVAEELLKLALEGLI